MAMLRSFLLLFIIFSMGNAELDLVERCPSGWTNFGLRCYKYFPQTVNWITAEKNCQSLGGNLASVHNKVENDVLLSLLPSSPHAWIGAHDGVQDGQWMWSDGSEFDHTNWCPGEPNNQPFPENCMEINAIRCWNDAPCPYKFGYICATGP